MKLKSVMFGVLASCAFLFSPANSYAAASCKTGDCACWIKAGGYCTNYIKIKTGKSQSGNANTWKSTPGITVQKGDVAIFKSNHVAYVESVNKDKNGKPTSVNVSEYNWGLYSGTPNDKSCSVTNKFGIVSTRTVNVSSVDGGFWRP